MMVGKKRAVVGFLGWLLVVAVTSRAADLGKTIASTEGRKRAAENGLKEIKAKSPQPSEQIRAAYVEAANKQNAWLDVVCQAVEQGSTAAPDVSTAAQSAADSLVEWVNVRNRALGLPELTGAIADSTKKSVVQDLLDIANETWKNNRSTDAKKRTSAASSLKDRLRWRAFEEI
jgi:pyruvate/2-oxoglutarate dehydrogenase complex dihydrolipoamide acyltransferase (E2) component